MATQNSTGARNLIMNTKVDIGKGKGMSLKSQPITGKLGDGMTSMGGAGALGQAVKTVKSNPISGPKNMQAGNTAMGSGGVINGFVPMG